MAVKNVVECLFQRYQRLLSLKFEIISLEVLNHSSHFSAVLVYRSGSRPSSARLERAEDYRPPGCTLPEVRRLVGIEDPIMELWDLLQDECNPPQVVNIVGPSGQGTDLLVHHAVVNLTLKAFLIGSLQYMKSRLPIQLSYSTDLTLIIRVLCFNEGYNFDSF